MKEIVLTFGGIYGALGIIFGAFGAHILKKKFNEDQLRSFETGVKYQIYHALFLILTGILFSFNTSSQVVMGWLIIAGVFLFSFSIYGLTLSASMGKKLRLLGPVTPLGGLMLVLGWIIFTLNVSQLSF
ncbi:DUF423 domain-containing protein [soil metagenome]